MEFNVGFIYPKALTELDSIAKDAAEIAIEDMRRVLKRRILSGTPIGETGNLWSSWDITANPSGGGFDVYNRMPYSGWVEIGAGWPKPGPRTTAAKGGIWSRQAVGGIIAPIVEDPDWIDNALNLIVEYIRRQLKK